MKKQQIGLTVERECTVMLKVKVKVEVMVMGFVLVGDGWRREGYGK
jgi:hypothetical protein